jgi:very-short-patch-repair endonuclease
MALVHRDHSKRLLGFARRMRREATDAERKLWSILRDHRLCGHRFRRQHPVAGYILDFFCPKAQLAIELDGGQHADDEHRAYDERRDAILRQSGIEVMRFSDHDMLTNAEGVAKAILEWLEKEAAEPSPQPSP